MDDTKFSDVVPPLESLPSCPWCGHTPMPYDQRASTLLDMVLLLAAVVTDLKRAAEGVTR